MVGVGLLVLDYFVVHEVSGVAIGGDGNQILGSRLPCKVGRVLGD